jgi:CheY-like chemotaxis protein
MAGRLLSKAGYRVLEAAGGAEALSLAERQPGRIDLLLTDVAMPGMSGKELAERLRQARPDVRVLYTSGYPSEVIARYGVVGPDVPLLEKPFTRAELLQEVRRVLSPAPAPRAPSR